MAGFARRVANYKHRFLIGQSCLRSKEDRYFFPIYWQINRSFFIAFNVLMCQPYSMTLGVWEHYEDKRKFIHGKDVILCYFHYPMDIPWGGYQRNSLEIWMYNNYPFSGNPKGSIEPNMRIVSSIHMSSSPCIKVKKLPRELREMKNERGMWKSEGGGG